MKEAKYHFFPESQAECYNNMRSDFDRKRPHKKKEINITARIENP